MSSLQEAFTELEILPSPPLNNDEHKLVEWGLMQCYIQPNFDMIEAIESAIKAIYLGPALTLIDYVLTPPFAVPTTSCFDLYRAIEKTRPNAFMYIGIKNITYPNTISEK